MLYNQNSIIATIISDLDYTTQLIQPRFRYLIATILHRFFYGVTIHLIYTVKTEIFSLDLKIANISLVLLLDNPIFM